MARRLAISSLSADIPIWLLNQPIAKNLKWEALTLTTDSPENLAFLLLQFSGRQNSISLKMYLVLLFFRAQEKKKDVNDRPFSNIYVAQKEL